MKRESYVATHSIGEGLERKTSAKQERKNGTQAGNVDAREKLLACRNEWREPLRTARGECMYALRLDASSQKQSIEYRMERG